MKDRINAVLKAMMTIIVLCLVKTGTICAFAQEIEIDGAGFKPGTLSKGSPYSDMGFEMPEDELLGGSAPELPSAFDARTEYGVTMPIRDQGQYGTCWAFSSLGAIEANLVKNHKADAATVDLSEKHLAYWMAHLLPDPKGQFKGDIIEIAGSEGEDLTKTKPYLYRGGSSDYVVNVLASGRGPVSEDRAEFFSETDPSFTTEDAYLHNEYSLINSRVIDLSTAEGAANLKKAIMNNGAAVLDFGYYRGYETADGHYFNSDGDLSKITIHSVTVIGWDDNLDKNGFKTPPEHNGGWLARNSSGTTEKYDGYLWISYDERFIKSDAYTFEADETGLYDNVYQYDSGYNDAMITLTGDTASGTDITSAKIANVFTVPANKDKEYLTAISVKTNSGDAAYNVHIYRELSKTGGPQNGTEASEALTAGKFKEPGFYTIKLKNPVELKGGERFSVVLVVVNNDHPFKALAENIIENETKTLNGRSYNFNVKGSVNYDESWFVVKNESDKKYWYSLDEYFGEEAPFVGNWRIKAYTTGTSTIDPTPTSTPDLRPTPTPTSSPAPTSAPTPTTDPKSTDPTKRFSDVPAGKWYSKPDGPIAYVIANGIMTGTGNGTTFEPESSCTREMFVQILYNAEKQPGKGASNPFTDVYSSKWYFNAVTWALENGITSGKTPTLFGIGEHVTREQLAQFLMNYAKKRGYDTSARADLSKYPDAGTVSGWAGNAVSWANAKGIINGKVKNGQIYLDPLGEATRAETAQMISEFMKK